MAGMRGPTKINVQRLKRDIIACTGEGRGLSRRKLSLLASDNKNPDLVRDLISRGNDRQPTVETVVGLANAMGKSASDYIIETAATPTGKEKMYVVGRVQAGVWTEQPEWPKDEWYEVEVDPSPIPDAERFGLEMVGHSMDRLIPPGSILECVRVFGPEGPQPQDGQIVIVQRSQGELIETTCKQLEIRSDGTYVLHCQSYRDEFRDPVFMGKPDVGDFSDNGTRIVAIVLKATKDFFKGR